MYICLLFVQPFHEASWRNWLSSVSCSSCAHCLFSNTRGSYRTGCDSCSEEQLNGLLDHCDVPPLFPRFSIFDSRQTFGVFVSNLMTSSIFSPHLRLQTRRSELSTSKRSDRWGRRTSGCRESSRGRWSAGRPCADNCLRVNPAWRWTMRGRRLRQSTRRRYCTKLFRLEFSRLETYSWFVASCDGRHAAAF